MKGGMKSVKLCVLKQLFYLCRKSPKTTQMIKTGRSMLNNVT